MKLFNWKYERKKLSCNVIIKCNASDEKWHKVEFFSKTNHYLGNKTVLEIFFVLFKIFKNNQVTLKHVELEKEIFLKLYYCM